MDMTTTIDYKLGAARRIILETLPPGKGRSWTLYHVLVVHREHGAQAALEFAQDFVDCLHNRCQTELLNLMLQFAAKTEGAAEAQGMPPASVERMLALLNERAHRLAHA